MPIPFITHKGDKSTRFKCTMYDNQNGVKVLLDLTPYDTYQMEFQNEAISSNIVTASLFGTAGQGIIKYDNTSSTFLDQQGTWRRRGIVSNSGTGLKFTGSWIEWENVSL